MALGINSATKPSPLKIVEQLPSRQLRNAERSGRSAFASLAMTPNLTTRLRHQGCGQAARFKVRV